MLYDLEKLQIIHKKTLKIINEIRELKKRAELSDAEFKNLARLTVELSELSPPNRFAWVDGIPVIDIFQELINVEKGKTHEREC